MTIDIELGAPFESENLELASDSEGVVVATLVRRSCDGPSNRGVLYIHGYTDYFFQRELADQLVGVGYHFYALDLRKSGRSIRPHQTPNFIDDLRTYYEELDKAISLVRERDGVERLTLLGHSTGGLLTSLYAHDRRREGTVQALVLNSPFFDLNDIWFRREVLAELISTTIAPFDPMVELPGGYTGAYGMSLHKDHHGDWDYNLAWKPIVAFPLRAGWLAAVHRAQKELSSGLDIACPVLVLHAQKSVWGSEWSIEWQRADAVLNIADIVRESGKLGGHVTRVAVPDGMHDLTLSEPEARAYFYGQLRRWLRAYA